MPHLCTLPCSHFHALITGQALEALRKLRTEKVQEAKEMKLKLDHARTHKDNADQLRGQVQEGQAKEAALQKEIASLDQQMEQLQEVGFGFRSEQSLAWIKAPGCCWKLICDKVPCRRRVPAWTSRWASCRRWALLDSATIYGQCCVM